MRLDCRGRHAARGNRGRRHGRAAPEGVHAGASAPLPHVPLDVLYHSSELLSLGGGQRVLAKVDDVVGEAGAAQQELGDVVRKVVAVVGQQIVVLLVVLQGQDAVDVLFQLVTSSAGLTKHECLCNRDRHGRSWAVADQRPRAKIVLLPKDYDAGVRHQVDLLAHEHPGHAPRHALRDVVDVRLDRALRQGPQRRRRRPHRGRGPGRRHPCRCTRVQAQRPAHDRFKLCPHLRIGGQSLSGFRHRREKPFDDIWVGTDHLSEHGVAQDLIQLCRASEHIADCTLEAASPVRCLALLVVNGCARQVIFLSAECGQTIPQFVHTCPVLWDTPDRFSVLHGIDEPQCQ
mmetsp:Transcript_12533/g.35734  ORF Transcript_12533/g.35734 Transcript_12533/m.35734 type:complete len:345 (+) Transcript_12533:325-1359(+)